MKQTIPYRYRIFMMFFVFSVASTGYPLPI